MSKMSDMDILLRQRRRMRWKIWLGKPYFQIELLQRFAIGVLLVWCATVIVIAIARLL